MAFFVSGQNLEGEVPWMKKGTFILILIMLIGLMLLRASVSYAHKVQMFAYPEGDRIYVEGYFPDGRKAKNSKVTVYDTETGKVVFEGTTDREGKISFKAPEAGKLKIVLNAGLGHRAEYTINVGDTTSSRDISQDESDNISDDNTGRKVSTAIDSKDLQIVVERAVGEAIRPLMRSVAEMKGKTQLSEVIGGIGYIFGIMGIVLYFKSRNKE